MVYSTGRFVLCLTLCHFVLVFFSPFSIAITSLGEERANLSAFRTFVRFVLVWICRFPLPLGRAAVCDCGIPGIFSYLFYSTRFFRIRRIISARRKKITTNKRTFGHVRLEKIQQIGRAFAQSDKNVPWMHFVQPTMPSFFHADN